MNVIMPPLHKGQLEIKNSKARFKVAACGRRWGKTREAAAEGFAEMLKNKRVWWVAPTYKICQYGWRLATSFALQIPRVEIRLSDRSITYDKGEFIFRSADNPDNLRGEGIDLLILDEAAFIPKEVWTQVLRPSLIDRKGRALFSSTPNGKNWFYTIYLYGQDPERTRWESWQRPSWANPFLPRDEIAELKRDMSEKKYSQEIEAKFVDFEGRVFPTPVISPRIKKPDGSPVVFGIDIARSPDATTVGICHAKKPRILTVESSHRDYMQQLNWIKMLVEKWKPNAVVVEENGVGAPICDVLSRFIPCLIPFSTTNQSKLELVDAMIVAMEKEGLTFPNQKDLILEIENYTCKKTSMGKYTFGAPEGLHDDLVMGVMLALYAQTMGNLPTRAFRL